MKFTVDNNRTFDTAREAADYIIENLSDDIYDAYLDDVYGDINICGIEYAASLALYCTDETAYYCGRNDYYDCLASDIVYDLDELEIGEIDSFYGFDVEAVED